MKRGMSMRISGYSGEMTTFDRFLVAERLVMSRFKLLPYMKHFAMKPSCLPRIVLPA